MKGEISAHDLLEASVARAIFKLVRTKDGKPAIFIEPTYTNLNKSDLSLDKYFNLFADLVLSQPMGVRMMRGAGNEVVTVPASQNPAGQYEDCGAGNFGWTRESIR